MKGNSIRFPRNSNPAVVTFWRQLRLLFGLFLIVAVYALLFNFEQTLFSLSVLVIMTIFFIVSVLQLTTLIKLHNSRNELVQLIDNKLFCKNNDGVIFKVHKKLIKSISIIRTDIDSDGPSSCPSYGLTVDTDVKNLITDDYSKEDMVEAAKNLIENLEVELLDYGDEKVDHERLSPKLFFEPFSLKYLTFAKTVKHLM